MNHKNNNTNYHDPLLIAEKVMFYIFPFLINGGFSGYKRNYIQVKGAIIDGIMKNIEITILIILSVGFIYYFIYSLYKRYKKFKSHYQLTISIIFSPFFFSWMATLVYQNFSMQYFDLRILIVLYVLLFFSQYMFIKKIKEQ